MPLPKKDGIAGAGAGGKLDNRQNGNRGSFRTDAAISNSRFGNERVLQPWVPDSSDATNGALEKSNSGGAWDQFAENERLFGLKTDYDENIYTTAINKNHPQYRERIAAAERKAREIERSAPTTAHVAEERIMDHVGGGDDQGENEEDKYSGVRRQDFPPLAGRENKYTPPAKRAPAAQSNVKGAPIDPAIISSQIKAPPKKQPSPAPAPASEESKTPVPDSNKNGVTTKNDDSKLVTEKKAAEATTTPEPKAVTQPATTKATDAKPADKNSTLRNSTTAARNEGAPSATSTVEHDVLKEFKTFATQQRQNAEKARSNKARADKEVKLTELKKFANSFKLSTPVPTDLVSIIAKDPLKQKEIQAKAIKNAEDVAKAKADSTTKDKTTPSKEAQPKAAGQSTPAAASASATPSDSRPSRTSATTQATPPAATQNRHPGARGQFPQQPYHQQYRNNRGGGQHGQHGQHMPPQQQTGTLAHRLRTVEQQKFSQPPAGQPPHAANQEMRAPPTGPANNVEPGYRRISGVPGHVGAKLNPNSHEFRPSPFAATFNPNGHPSASSSPRSAVNNVPDAPVPAAPAAPATTGQLIRRKTKAIDVKKCYILSHIQTFTPGQGRKWEDNAGLRPSFDTLPTWRQLQDHEKPDSTMRLTYKEFFERQPFGGPPLATPNPQHVVPQMPHQHQLPFHLQHGAHNMGPRQSPHMAPMQMHTPQHGPVPHPPYGNDDHRMMHSNSAQSFASPRLGNVPVAAYPSVNSPAQVPYNQPVYMGPGTPQMGFRSFSNNPQYMSPQQGQMGGPMMMQPQFMPGPQGMVPGPQMMYPGNHPQFMQSGPQPVPGANGYPSPGRPAAPMMVHQGSQQGQPMYGMSPNVQYNQPVFTPGQPNGPMRGGYGSPGPQHFGTSPQQGHQYGQQHRNGSNNYNKGYGGQAQHQTPQTNHAVPAASQGRTTDGSDEAK
ncbi:poly(A)-binding protein binding protein [Neonectria punicea]|uniref:Poly(A)-binding protein binding protein n=1 Tax=Neonectria punicea TaxID=979145 RepID=A0ABR1H5F4_9HYPO